MRLWRHISASSLAGVSLIVLIIGFVIAFIAIRQMGILDGSFAQQANNQGLFILASALLAISGVLFSSAARFHSEARDAAFKVLRKSTDDAVLYKHMRVIRDLDKALSAAGVSVDEFGKYIYVPISNSMDPKLKRIYDYFQSKDRNFVTSIFQVGNFFEEIMIAITLNEINEDILYEFYAGMFVRFYGQIEHYLPYLRNDAPKAIEGYHTHGAKRLPELYEQLDVLNRRWSTRYWNQYKGRI